MIVVPRRLTCVFSAITDVTLWAVIRRTMVLSVGLIALLAPATLVASTAVATPTTPNSPSATSSATPTTPSDIRFGGGPHARTAEDEDLCADEYVDRFNSCDTGIATVDWGSGPVVPTEWTIAYSVELRSQYNSGNVSLKLEAKNGEYSGVDAPENGWVKFEFFLKDAGSPAYLPMKTVQPIEIKFQEAANDTALPVTKTVSPDIVVAPDDKYRLAIKISAKPDVPGGNYGTAAVQGDMASYIRCDGDANNLFGMAPGTRGCINPDSIPVAYHSAATYPWVAMPKIAENIRTAQAAGSPGGSEDTDLPLHRVIDPQRRANYDASCGNESRRYAAIGERPLPAAEWECDEYPFASSREGGIPAQMMWVPKSENDAQGNLLANFYRSNRILIDDEFRAFGPA